MSRSAPVKALAAAAILVACAVATPAMAEDEKFPDRWMFRLGGYNVSDANTLVRLDANNAPVGAYIDFAQTLGGQTSASVGRFDGLFRINDKHGLGFSWYSLRFDGNRSLSADIDWGGATYPLGTTVDSEIKFNIYKVNYQYSLINSSEVELGALAGLHVMDLSVAIDASGIGQARSDSVTAPLPVLGLFARYNFTPRVSTYFNYQFFFINYQDTVKGGLQDFLLGLEYRVSTHFAVGAAFNRFGTYLESKQDQATLFVDTRWRGTMLYGSLYF
ncbi:MAG TPA: hypothetical protein VFV84_08075 [Burkholderiales bacterium]|nr:hypothetical protein [Burkholderiales bacterium]